MKNGTALLWRIALLTLGLSSPALAVDGMLEINQACAVSIGCFSGDAAGLPVTITTAGSYRLTGNLTVPDVNTDGITVSADDVSIDLNGFAISGPVTCSGDPTDCSGAGGSGDGIVRTAASIRGTSVKNGSISGMGNSGVVLGVQAEVTNLKTSWNHGRGIWVGEGSVVSGSSAYQNDYIGIEAGNGSVISGNTAYQNGDWGIYSWGSIISGNTTDGNSIGILAAGSALVVGNTARRNENDGMAIGLGSVVSDNVVAQNMGHGLSFSDTGSAYGGNVIWNNTEGTVEGTALQLGENACNGSTTCP